MSEQAPNFSEQAWLEKLRNGEERALRALFDRYYGAIVRDIYRLIPDSDTCKDLVQEVFVELWRKKESLEIQVSIYAYLRRAAVNKALNHIKSNKRYVFEEPDKQNQIKDSSAQDIAQKEHQGNLEDALHKAIETLPEKCRAVFALSRFEHLSHKEIAEKLGISVKTIENQITKAMKMLREALSDEGYLSLIVILGTKWLENT